VCIRIQRSRATVKELHRRLQHAYQHEALSHITENRQDVGTYPPRQHLLHASATGAVALTEASASPARALPTTYPPLEDNMSYRLPSYVSCTRSHIPCREGFRSGMVLAASMRQT
jgi:hypothetical protein